MSPGIRPGSGTIAESMIGEIGWALLSLVGAFGLAGIALNRDEHIDSMWLVMASVGIYLTAYCFYAKFIEAKVMSLDDRCATPADGRDALDCQLRLLEHAEAEIALIIAKLAALAHEDEQVKLLMTHRRRLPHRASYSRRLRRYFPLRFPE